MKRESLTPQTHVPSMNYGATLIELIIAMAVASVILGLIGGYLAQSSDNTKRNQIRSEVQDRVRSTMQVLVQDLNLVGSSRLVDADNNSTAPLDSTCPLEQCLFVDEDSFFKYLQVKYVSSLGSSTQPCHQVRYRYSEVDNLRRLDIADATCNPELLTTWAITSPVQNYLARNIIAFELQFLCSNGKTIDTYPNTLCPSDGTAYPRSVMITIVGRSVSPIEGTPTQTFTTVSGSTITCPEDYTCFAMNQEVQMPNLKDR